MNHLRGGVIRCVAVAALAAAGLPKAVALSSDEAAAGRSVTERYAAAVVGVELVASISLTIGDMPASPRHVRLQANGTVISPDGLTATSLIEIDPRRTAEAATRSLTLPGNRRVKIGATSFSDVKLRLGDGTEVPAQVVYEDPDIDLALIAPLSAAAPVADAAGQPNGAGGAAAAAPDAPAPSDAPKREYAAVSLENTALPLLLADYFVVSRAPASLQWVPEVHATTIEGIVGAPRPCYIPNGFVAGCPMLDGSGRLLGLCLTQMVNGHPLMSGGRPSGVIVPASLLAADARKADPTKAAAPAPVQADDDDMPDAGQ